MARAAASRRHLLARPKARQGCHFAAVATARNAARPALAYVARGIGVNPTVADRF